jgi:uncharacterized protein YggU (UPF0235/DUF167 family)
VAVLAKALGVARSSIELVRGESSKVKLVAIHGVGEDEVRARLDPRAGRD